MLTTGPCGYPIIRSVADLVQAAGSAKAMASPISWKKLKETRQRLHKCWKVDLDWSIFPASLKDVSV